MTWDEQLKYRYSFKTKFKQNVDESCGKETSLSWLFRLSLCVSWPLGRVLRFIPLNIFTNVNLKAAFFAIVYSDFKYDNFKALAKRC